VQERDPGGSLATDVVRRSRTWSGRSPFPAGRCRPCLGSGGVSPMGTKVCRCGTAR